jgi:triacylglycerol esterase/lipase EstA (alpha/beta hydrolase family)
MPRSPLIHQEAPPAANKPRMATRLAAAISLVAAFSLAAAATAAAAPARAQARAPARVTAQALAHVQARARAGRLPVIYSFAAGVAAELVSPGSAPPGSNDFSCKPTAAHPYPVVLVHGTFGNMTDSWQALSPLLKNAGYCVFALNYGGSVGNLFQGYEAIENSAAQLASFVTQVLAATGASKVDIVGHSQGGMMPRYYLRFLGGAGKVNTLIGLAPSNHGTNLDGLLGLLQVFPGGSSFVTSLCAACTEQLAGSSFLAKLNSGGDTVPGVTYTVIETKYDEVVTPYTSAFLSGPKVTNITVQNQCFLDLTDHLGIIYDPVALHDVLNALDPAHATPAPCVLVLPVL